MTDMKHFDILISGILQNTAFAFQVMKKADETGICGYATYFNPNTLKIEAEGIEDHLKEFIDFCKTGIPEARISELTVKQSHYMAYKGFIIIDKTSIKE